MDQRGLMYVGLDISADMLMQQAAHAGSGGTSSCCLGLLHADMGQGMPFRSTSSSTSTSTHCSSSSSSTSIHCSLSSNSRSSSSSSSSRLFAFDGALSISAVQWLLFRPDREKALASFFKSLFE